MRRRQPGPPPVEVKVTQEDSGRRPHPQGLPVLPVDLQGGAEVRAVAARNAALPTVREAAEVFGTLPMTEEGPPRQRRKVQWSYVEGSTYVGEALDEKRDGHGMLTRHGGVRYGVSKNGKFDKGTATNVKWSDDCRYTGQCWAGSASLYGLCTAIRGEPRSTSALQPSVPAFSQRSPVRYIPPARLAARTRRPVWRLEIPGGDPNQCPTS
ncbi:hypothetical protein THAOC_34765 [Thalassiosira oceanica]|uniref:Uncharacterized protein n=1 Tax=Thalassiosira oceanica TaxID=159749 RepID=K0RBT1_THAOC|nr:hypothetical protein THAOC_34765 [Thalassiosira oceanica]|eukprot:EJK46561.1 hypothetical protein THAOC_34765 [Thalassiosira oceanica]